MGVYFLNHTTHTTMPVSYDAHGNPVIETSDEDEAIAKAAADAKRKKRKRKKRDEEEEGEGLEGGETEAAAGKAGLDAATAFSSIELSDELLAKDTEGAIKVMFKFWLVFNYQCGQPLRMSALLLPLFFSLPVFCHVIGVSKKPYINPYPACHGGSTHKLPYSSVS